MKAMDTGETREDKRYEKHMGKDTTEYVYSPLHTNGNSPPVRQY
jgi:hypothetical protein